jgi:hypothetical protein
MKAKSDAERRHDVAQAELAAAERAEREAEQIITSSSGKILTKQRSLSDLKNTVSRADVDKNSAANRYAKQSRLESDIHGLEADKSNAESAQTEARERTRLARAEASDAASTFSVEAHRKRLDAETQRTEIAVSNHELQKQKFAQTEQAAVEAAKTKLEEARLSGASAERIAKLEREFKAASQRFEWEQTFELESVRIDGELAKLDRAASGQLDLSQLQGQITEEKAALDHVRNLGVIDANTQADVTRIRTTAKEHRKNVTHEVNEDIRKAFEMLSINAEEAGFQTMNAIKLLIVKHVLDKNFETHKTKLAREGRSEDLAELAADYQIAAQWISQQQKV